MTNTRPTSMKRFTALLLSFLLAVSSSLITAGAVSADKPPLGDEVLEENMATYYFLAPDDWCNTDKGALNSDIGAYWWSGPEELKPGEWPGMKAEPAPEIHKNAFKITAPNNDEVNQIIFNSYVDAGFWHDPDYGKLSSYSHQTVDIDVEWDNYDGMIYVLSLDDIHTKINEFSGSKTISGDWFSLDSFKSSYNYGTYNFPGGIETITEPEKNTDTDTHTDIEPDCEMATYYFLAPDDWFNTDKGALNSDIGAYWWSGPEELKPGEWPGMKAEPAPEIHKNAFKITAPNNDEVNLIIFNSYVDVGLMGRENYRPDLVAYSHQTADVDVEEDNYDGMIYVLALDDKHTAINEYSGAKSYYGNWFSLDSFKSSYNYGTYNFTSAVPKITQTIGDVTSDGIVDSLDALYVLRASTGLEDFSDYQKNYADVDNDRKITSADALLILRASVELETLESHLYSSGSTNAENDYVTYYFLAPDNYFRKEAGADNTSVAAIWGKDNEIMSGDSSHSEERTMTPAPEIHSNAFKIDVPNDKNINNIMFTADVFVIDPITHEKAHHTDNAYINALDSNKDYIYVLAIDNEHKIEVWGNADVYSGDWFSLDEFKDSYNYSTYNFIDDAEDSTDKDNDTPNKEIDWPAGTIINTEFKLNKNIGIDEFSLGAMNSLITYNSDVVKPNYVFDNDYNDNTFYTETEDCDAINIFANETDSGIKIGILTKNSRTGASFYKDTVLLKMEFIVTKDCSDEDLNINLITSRLALIDHSFGYNTVSDNVLIDNEELMRLDLIFDTNEFDTDVIPDPEVYPKDTDNKVDTDSDTDTNDRPNPEVSPEDTDSDIDRDVDTDVIPDPIAYPDTDSDSHSTADNEVDGITYTYGKNSASVKEVNKNDTKITIPAEINHNKVEIILQGAFSQCTNVQVVVLPDGLRNINDKAFENCKKLVEVDIPDSVTSISADAFKGCDNVMIYGNKGSYAQKYANDNNLPFICLQNLMGDMDEDGKITSADSLLILRQSVSLESFNKAQLLFADADGDGKITSADSLEVLRASVGLSIEGKVGVTVK